MTSLEIVGPSHAIVNGNTTATKTMLRPTPTDTPRTITELISIRAKALPHEPILGYPSGNLDYIEYTFSDLEAFSRRLAQVYSKHLPVRTFSKQDAVVVALLGPSNLDYVITALALTRLGFTVLFLSTRISQTAYLSLLEATGCRYMVVHPSFQKVVSALEASMPDLEVIRIGDQSDYMCDTPPGSPNALEAELLHGFDLNEETKKVCWIIHSSGSTGLPKPIYQTHNAALRNYEQNMNMQGFITLPLFHAHGLSSVFRAITSVKKIYMHSASLPLTRPNLLHILHRHDFEIFYGVPYALKLLSETQEGIDALAAMKVVMFGGSACPDALGDLLTEGGVNLVSHYGTTETGQLMTSFRPPGDKAWNYVRVHEKLKPYVRFEARGTGANLYELVVLPGWPSKVATNREDGSYATKDLFEPHPSIPDAWKYTGRLDDTLVLMNGEKAIPIAMEQSLRQNKLVQEAVMFGAGKSQLGMIIIESDLAVGMSEQELLDALWPTIVAENKAMPAYAQLARDMIKVMPAGTPYPSTDKGTMIRQAFYRVFQAEIDEVYAAQAESNSAAGTLVLSDQELRAYIRKQIQELLGATDNGYEVDDLADDTDLFALGIDSLQSTRLRSQIVKDINLNGSTLPPNVVFEYPTIAKLAGAISSIRDSKAVAARDVVKDMEELIVKYSAFPQHKPVPRTSTESCVVVTGATGSLGAHLVAQLVLRDDIDEVCCLVRANSAASAQQRVMQSLKERKLHDTLSAEHRRKITSYPTDFSKPDLGLGEALYDRISHRLTHLIHCAWSVNFNKNLASFEADCIAGARHLILLCLSARQPTPASFNFCSSVSTVVNTPGETIPETLPESLACAQGMGYAQSKLVTEHIVNHAAQQTGIQARVLRIGQIVADTRHGIWNDTEAIPLMLRSAVTSSIVALPALDELARWLPVDSVASAVMDISLSNTEQRVFNVVNPRSFHWTRDLLPALRRAGLSDFQEVSQREWIRRLRASDPDPEVNPTIKLVEFFAAKYDNDVTKRKRLEYDTQAAVRLAPVLAAVPALSEELVKKFVDNFLATSWALNC